MINSNKVNYLIGRISALTDIESFINWIHCDSKKHSSLELDEIHYRITALLNEAKKELKNDDEREG